MSKACGTRSAGLLFEVAQRCKLSLPFCVFWSDPVTFVRFIRHDRAILLIKVQQHIQFVQPPRLFGQFRLLRKGSGHLCSGIFKLLGSMGKLRPGIYQVLRDLFQRVVDTGDIAAGIRSQYSRMGQLAFERHSHQSQSH